MTTEICPVYRNKPIQLHGGQRFSQYMWWTKSYPRVCSTCGGTRPEDVIRLVELGWEIQWADEMSGILVPPPRTMFPTHAVNLMHFTALQTEELLDLYPQRREDDA